MNFGSGEMTGCEQSTVRRHRRRGCVLVISSKSCPLAWDRIADVQDLVVAARDERLAVGRHAGEPTLLRLIEKFGGVDQWLAATAVPASRGSIDRRGDQKVVTV